MNLPPYHVALDACLEKVWPLPSESVALNAATGRILRRHVTADRDQPPFDRATMDGFAVVGDVPLCREASWPVSATISAGETPRPSAWRPVPGTVVRIATGAPMIAGTDAVVPVEQTSSVTCGASEAVKFSIDHVSRGTNVHARGSDARTGEVVIEAGTLLGPHHIGIAATVGATTLEVSRKPKVSVLTSGDEIVPPSTTTNRLGLQQIRNSNGPLMTSMVLAAGASVTLIDHAPDEKEATLAAAKRCLQASDLVVSTGGVSVGHRDWLAWAWGRLGVKHLVRGVAIQPGKPIMVGRTSEKEGVWVVGLPGNPVSVMVTAHLFLWPIILRMLDAAGGLPWHPIELDAPMHCRVSRQLFRAVTRDKGGRAKPVPWHGSGDLMHLGSADGVVRLPCRGTMAEAGEVVPFLPLIG